MVSLLMLSHVALADQANVFIYHRFNDSRYPSTNISLEAFRAHLDLLSQQEFNVLTLGQVVDRLQKGISLPQRCAVISVDDAFRSFLTAGWPLLKQYGYPATLFVSTGTVGGGEYLNWEELKGLQKEGVEIGSHSDDHAYLLDRLEAESDSAWRVRVSADIRRSQEAFESYLGTAPKLFAYPYGEFSPELVALIKSAGFIAAFGQQSGVITAEQDLFSLPRFPMGGDYASLPEFSNKLFMKSLPINVVSPESPVIAKENPPKLRFYLSQESIDDSSLRCFVPGQFDCIVRQVGEGGLYEAVATQALSGRRSKYTLTAANRNGKTWYWFSQLWVRPSSSETSNTSVSR